MKKNYKRILITLFLLALTLFIFFKISPYPSVWVARYVFNKEAIKVNNALEVYTSKSIKTTANINYDSNDTEALLDVYFDKDSIDINKKLSAIIWTHGGGLISGNKEQVGNYCKMLASQGYIVISVDYSVAPEKKYPTPLRQLNKALQFISNNAKQFQIDNSSIFLAGDSGGSMISAQVANIITNPYYAKKMNIKPGIQKNQLKGLLLYCGIYEVENLNTDGEFGSFLKNVFWAYFAKKELKIDENIKTASVKNYLTKEFPPSFISAGNNDPLLPQSKLLAQELLKKQIYIDTLFFSKNTNFKLGHEYQFSYNEAGKEAFKKALFFLNTHKK